MINHNQQLNKYSPITYTSFTPKGYTHPIILPKKCPNCGKRGLRVKTEGTSPVTFRWCYECGWKGGM